jgi:hypothetical protein
MNRTIIFHRILFFVLSMGAIISGCKKEPIPEYEALPLPPRDALSIDFSSFGGHSKVSGTTEAFDIASGEMLVWDKLMYDQMAMPIQAFNTAYQIEPEWADAQHQWLWDYDYIHDNIEYRVNIYLNGADVEGAGYFLDMYMQKKGDKDFQRYLSANVSETVFHRGNDIGDIYLYHKNNPSGVYGGYQNNYVKVNYRYYDPQGQRYLSISNEIEGDVNNGKSIKISKIIGWPDYPCFAEIYPNDSLREDTRINWNPATGTGSISDAFLFGDFGYEHCWNAAHQDTTCF